MMKMNHKWIALLLVIGIICAVCVGCDNPQSGTDNPGGTPGNTPGKDTSATTQGETPDAPVTKYGNYTTEGTARTLEDLFKDEVKHTEDTFATGTSYSDEKIANVYKIADYIANYEKYVEEYNAQEEFDKLYAETGFTMDFGFGAEMIKHYIGMSGETYDYTARMKEMLMLQKEET